MLPPLISVIVPVHDGEKYLAEALRSIRSQEDPALELLVIDDGSTDRSAAIAREEGARCVSQTNKGIGASRNRGIAEAGGELIAFLDADDVWSPGRLALQRTALEDDPALDIVAGHVRQFLSPELEPELRQRLRCPAEPLPGFSFGAMLMRRRAFERVGPVAVERPKAECVDWCMRARDAGVAIRMLPEIVLFRRLHDRNHGRLHRNGMSDYAHAIKASLDRRRAAR